MNKLVKTIDKADLDKEFLKSLNGILDLTGRELQLLQELTDIQRNAKRLPEVNRNVIGTENRRYIVQKLKITPDNLSRYITKFKRCGILVKSRVQGEYQVNEALIPEIIGDRVQITIILKVSGNDKK